MITCPDVLCIRRFIFQRSAGRYPHAWLDAIKQRDQDHERSDRNGYELFFCRHGSPFSLSQCLQADAAAPMRWGTSNHVHDIATHKDFFLRVSSNCLFYLYRLICMISPSKQANNHLCEVASTASKVTRRAKSRRKLNWFPFRLWILTKDSHYMLRAQTATLPP